MYSTCSIAQSSTGFPLAEHNKITIYILEIDLPIQIRNDRMDWQEQKLVLQTIYEKKNKEHNENVVGKSHTMIRLGWNKEQPETLQCF